MENMLKAILEEMKSIRSEMATKQELTEIKQSLARIENEQGTKISALFDGYTQHNDQLERLQDHLDERLDAIQTDLSYVVGKVAQHDRNIVRLNKIAK